MTATICYIHGANSSPTSFSWLKENLGEHNPVLIEYSCTTPLADNIARITEELSNVPAPFFLVGHSLGGVIALAVSKAIPDKVDRLCTISAPFGGSRFASVMRWAVRSQLFEDIRSHSPLLTALRAEPSPVPHLAIVTTSGGLPFMGEANDGVVTVDSQTAMPLNRIVELERNHFEVLMAEETACVVRTFFDLDDEAATPAGEAA